MYPSIYVGRTKHCPVGHELHLKWENWNVFQWRVSILIKWCEVKVTILVNELGSLRHPSSFCQRTTFFLNNFWRIKNFWSIISYAHIFFWVWLRKTLKISLKIVFPKVPLALLFSLESYHTKLIARSYPTPEKFQCNRWVNRWSYTIKMLTSFRKPNNNVLSPTLEETGISSLPNVLTEWNILGFSYNTLLM